MLARLAELGLPQGVSESGVATIVRRLAGRIVRGVLLGDVPADLERIRAEEEVGITGNPDHLGLLSSATAGHLVLVELRDIQLGDLVHEGLDPLDVAAEGAVELLGESALLGRLFTGGLEGRDLGLRSGDHCDRDGVVTAVHAVTVLDREDGARDSDNLDVPLVPALLAILQANLRVVVRDALGRLPVPFADRSVGRRAERDGDDHRIGLLLRGGLLEIHQRLLDLIQLLRGLRTPAPQELHRTRNRNSECLGRLRPRVGRRAANGGAETFHEPTGFPAAPPGDVTDTIRQLEAVGGVRPLARLLVVGATDHCDSGDVLPAERDDLVLVASDEQEPRTPTAGTDLIRPCDVLHFTFLHSCPWLLCRGRELPQYCGESPLNMSSALDTCISDTHCATHKWQQSEEFSAKSRLSKSYFPVI